MPGMNGIELIKKITQFLEKNKVEKEDMPRFAFKAQQFWELPPETIKQVFELGIKQEDIIEKVTKKQQILKYFKRISYFYMRLAEPKVSEKQVQKHKEVKN